MSRKVKDRKIRTGYKPSQPTAGENRQDRRARNATRWFATLIAAIPILEQQAHDWAEGFNSTTGGAPGGRGSISRPTETRALNTPAGEGLADDCSALARELDDWLREGSRLTSRALRLLPQEHPVADMLARHAEARWNGAGECKACGDWVEGIDADQDTGHRLRRGLDAKCFKKWERAGKPDLVTWIADQRHRNGLCQQRECLHQHGDDETPGVTA